jgi:hypothetical protein
MSIQKLGDNKRHDHKIKQTPTLIWKWYVVEQH